ncbi:hypothetical protein J2T13_000893 [Paenibacillus sp. DS2015]|uniref:hypothetical protein n=1 Tax=Paenibacillus sp. DS2015 TaxID=3373917 RepID=UPI003D2600D1
MLVLSWTPFIGLAAVGVASHMIERRMEYAGHGGYVLGLRILTHVVCAGICLSAWRDLFRYAGMILHVNGTW